MNERKPMIAGNWKMNLTLEQSISLVKTIVKECGGLNGVEILVAPPFTALSTVKKAIQDSGILLAAQNMHWELEGAYTGEISPRMLLEAGCSHVILGHSERRHLFFETNEMINLKTEAAISSGLVPIVCIGETLDQREQGQTSKVIREQLEGSMKALKERKDLPFSTILAYEPVWAIGTGKTATPEQAQEVHEFIRHWLDENFGSSTAGAIRILYGGSVKPANIKELMSMPDIDGALVGGASLKADSFIRIVRFQEK